MADDLKWIDTWNDAMTSLQLLQIDPSGFGGIWLKSPYGPVREAWLRELAAIGLSVVRLPGNLDLERLLGGIDLSATLQTGQLQQQDGLLTQARGGLVCIPMAERFPDALIAPLVQTVDSQAGALDPGFGVVALDESDGDDAPLNPALQERLGLWLDLSGIAPADVVGHLTDNTAVVGLCIDTPSLAVMRRAAPQVNVTDEQVAALCVTAQSLGIASLRIPTLALRVARAHAALNGQTTLTDDDLAFAARRVLAPRATQNPVVNAPPPEDSQAPEPVPESATNDGGETPETPPLEDAQNPDSEDKTGEAVPTAAVEEMLVAAALASLPNGILDRLLTRAGQSNGQALGRSGQLKSGAQRGRPMPPRPGAPGGHARLHVLATLRAAVPKQRLRARSSGARLAIRGEDFHVHRYQQSSASCLLLVLDASGSAALQRLAEAKGAVERLLEQSYARRDSVCIVAFKGAKAELLLPMTRSLVRAKRAMTGLPGGGGTPLAAGLKMAYNQAAQLKRQGVTPLLVILSDGRANVTLAGLGGRAQAMADADQWCTQWRQTGHQALWIDTSVQPDPQVQRLAQAMGGSYLPMPQAQAHRMAAAMDHLRRTSA